MVQQHELFIAHPSVLDGLDSAADFLSHPIVGIAYPERQKGEKEEETYYGDFGARPGGRAGGGGPPNICTLGGRTLKHILAGFYCEFREPLSCARCCLENQAICWQQKEHASFTDSAKRELGGRRDLERKEDNIEALRGRLHSCCGIVVSHMVKASTDYFRLELCGSELGCTAWWQNYSTP